MSVPDMALCGSGTVLLSGNQNDVYFPDPELILLALVSQISLYEDQWCWQATWSFISLVPRIVGLKRPSSNPATEASLGLFRATVSFVQLKMQAGCAMLCYLS